MRIASQPAGAAGAHSGAGASSADAAHLVFGIVVLVRCRIAQPPAAYIEQLHLCGRSVAARVHPARRCSHPESSRAPAHRAGIPGACHQFTQRDGRVRPAVGQLRLGDTAAQAAGRRISSALDAVRKSPDRVHTESVEHQPHSRQPDCGAVREKSQLGVVPRPAPRSVPAGVGHQRHPSGRSRRIHHPQPGIHVTKGTVSTDGPTPVN